LDFFFIMYVIQHCFICRPSDSTCVGGFRQPEALTTQIDRCLCGYAASILTWCNSNCYLHTVLGNIYCCFFSFYKNLFAKALILMLLCFLGDQLLPLLCSPGEQLLPLLCSPGEQLLPLLCSPSEQLLPLLCSPSEQLLSLLCTSWEELVLYLCPSRPPTFCR
jgi:hypothetical protein